MNYDAFTRTIEVRPAQTAELPLSDGLAAR